MWNALTFGGNAQFALVTLGLGTAITAILGGVLWTFSSLPLAFKVLAVLGIAVATIGTVAELASRIKPLLGGVHLIQRPSTIRLPRQRKETMGQLGLELAFERDACFTSVLIYNARESGGDRAKALEVVPHVEIFDHGGDLLAEHIGWDVAAARDFSPNREQHRLYIVGKWLDEEDCFFVQGRPPNEYSVGSKRMVQSTYDVRVTLRGKNVEPMVAWYLLSNRGKGRCPQLSPSE